MLNNRTMIDFMTKEQRNRIFERLITNASDILCEEFGLPRRTFAEIQEMMERQSGENDEHDVSDD